MLDIIWFVIALLLPWLLGVVCLRMIGSWSVCLSYGFVIGIFLTSVLMFGIDALGFALQFYSIAAVLLVLISAGFLVSRRYVWPSDNAQLFYWADQSPWEKAWFAFFLLLVILRLGGLASEIWLRPLFPWDAWTTWAVKPRVWFEYNHLVPFVSATEWLASSDRVYTIDAWHYPIIVPLMQLWVALGVGHWDESFSNMLWLLCTVALGMGFYGQARLWGVRPLVAILFTYLLLSLPLLDTHTALAGYSDLWLAAALLLATMAFCLWARTRNPYQGVLVLVLALFCPFIKIEGSVWILAFIPAVIIARCTLKALLYLVGLIVLLLIVWLWSGGFSMSLPWVGRVDLTTELISFPYIGRFEFALNVNWWPFVHNFFILDNWHLFWYLAIAVIVFSVPRIVSDRLILTCAVPLLVWLLLLFTLFCLTQAQEWAAKYTSINRLFLHIVPALLFYLLILVNAMIQQSRYITTLSGARSDRYRRRRWWSWSIRESPGSHTRPPPSG